MDMESSKQTTKTSKQSQKQKDEDDDQPWWKFGLGSDEKKDQKKTVIQPRE